MTIRFPNYGAVAICRPAGRSDGSGNCQRLLQPTERFRRRSLVVRPLHAVQISGAILILAALSVLITVGCSSSSKGEVPKLLARAKLSPLPPSATNVAYYQWNGLFTGETYAKFQLSPGDLRAFVSNSPSLQGIKPTVYDTNYQHVPFPPASANMDVKHYDYFYSHPKFPKWNDWTIRGKGKKYVIDWGPNMMILIDEDRHIVWLHVVKG